MFMHFLATQLHKTVAELYGMPTSEYANWVAYFEGQQRQQQAESGNILAMDPEQAIGAMTSG